MTAVNEPADIFRFLLIPTFAVLGFLAFVMWAMGKAAAAVDAALDSGVPDDVTLARSRELPTSYRAPRDTDDYSPHDGCDHLDPGAGRAWGCPRCSTVVELVRCIADDLVWDVALYTELGVTE